MVLQFNLMIFHFLAGLCEGVLAGLQSVEDYSSVKLKSTKESIEISKDTYPDPMLILIKGKRNVQIKLIEPIMENINPGDCYLLITQGKVKLIFYDFL